MNIRVFIAIGTSALVVPKAVLLVQTTTELLMRESELAWFNPGNATGILLSYTVAGGLVSLIAKTAQVKRVTPRAVLWWCGAGVLSSAVFISVREIVSALTNPKLGLLSATAALALVGYQALRLKLPEYSFDPHIRGQRMRKSKDIQQGQGKSMAGLIPWGADLIPPRWETEHFIILGNIGGGKTLFIKMCMAAVAHRDNELWFVFDPKPQFVPYLEALGREVLILNPLDLRRQVWDLAKDVNDAPTAQTFAKTLIKVRGPEDYWAMSAQGLLTEVLLFFIRTRQDWDLRDVLLAVSNPEDLRRIVGEDDLNAIIAEGLEGKNDKSGTNDYMLTLNNYLKKFRPIAALMHASNPKNRLSLKGLIRSERYGRKALVLGSDEDSREMMKTFNGLIFEMLVNFTLSLEDDSERRIWAWIDELASVAEYVGENLSRFQEKARSKGGCSVAATQSYPALVAKLGENYTDQIIELSKRIAITGGVEGRTAQVLSEVYFGEVEVVGTEAGTTKEYKSNSARSVDEEDVRPTHSRTTVPLVRKELLHSAAMPKTGPENGLTGFFFGGPAGPHWHTYPWQSVMDRTVPDAPEHRAYERIAMDDKGLVLKLWTPAEREQWNLSLQPKDGQPTERLRDETNRLDERFGDDEDQIPRSDVLQMLKFNEQELDELTAECGLGVGLEGFNQAQTTAVLARIGLRVMGLDIDWEDES